MTSLELLREEHRHLRARLEDARRLADSLDALAPEELVHQMRRIIGFLDRGLIPHALAEDAVLYPAVALAMGAAQATATMSRDHLEIVRYTEQLRHLVKQAERPTVRLRRDVRRILYSVNAIAELHLEKEEEVYLPLLEEVLTDEDAQELLADLEQAARGAAIRRVS